MPAGDLTSDEDDEVFWELNDAEITKAYQKSGAAFTDHLDLESLDEELRSQLKFVRHAYPISQLSESHQLLLTYPLRRQGCVRLWQSDRCSFDLRASQNMPKGTLFACGKLASTITSPACSPIQAGQIMNFQQRLVLHHVYMQSLPGPAHTIRSSIFVRFW